MPSTGDDTDDLISRSMSQSLGGLGGRERKEKSRRFVNCIAGIIDWRLISIQLNLEMQYQVMKLQLAFSLENEKRSSQSYD